MAQAKWRAGTTAILMAFLRLGALVFVDLIRPARPENRLPKRWLARPRLMRRMT